MLCHKRLTCKTLQPKLLEKIFRREIFSVNRLPVDNACSSDFGHVLPEAIYLKTLQPQLPEKIFRREIFSVNRLPVDNAIKDLWGFQKDASIS